MLRDFFDKLVRFDKFISVGEICYTESIIDKYDLIADLLSVRSSDDLIVLRNDNIYVSCMIKKFKLGELISHIKENDFVNDKEDYIRDIKIYKYKSEKLAIKPEKLAIINNGELLVLQNLK